MIRMATARSAKAVPERVAAVLDAHGFKAQERGLRAQDPSDDRGEGWGTRFGEAMADLGGGFALFGDYLTHRPDLLGLGEALALESVHLEGRFRATHLVSPSMTTSQSQAERLRHALPPDAEEAFDEVTPLESPQGDPLCEYFLANGRSSEDALGEDVVLCLRRPDLADEVTDDLPQLETLTSAFGELASSPTGRRRLHAAMDDFRLEIQRRLDLKQRDASLQGFADDLVDRDLLQVPRVFEQWTSPSCSVRQWLGETALDDPSAMPSAAGLAELGRQLHLTVLEQLLVAGQAPLNARWRLDRRGRLSLVEGALVHLPAASLPRLWAYLRHLASHHPEEAFEAIEGELKPAMPSADAHQLRLRMRQLVPFRDGGWSTRRDTLAELLALHWCLVDEMGFKPSPALETLWQCLYQTAALGRRLQLPGDPLRAALDDLRWLATFRRMRHLGDPKEMGQALENNLASLLEMPQKLDRLLQMWSGEGGDEIPLRFRVDSASPKRRHALHQTIGLAALMLAVGLISRQLPQMGLPTVWVERVSAFVLCLVGASLLSTILKT